MVGRTGTTNRSTAGERALAGIGSGGEGSPYKLVAAVDVAAGIRLGTATAAVTASIAEGS